LGEIERGKRGCSGFAFTTSFSRLFNSKINFHTMKKINHLIIAGLLLLCAIAGRAQSNQCVSVGGDNQLAGRVFFNYGSVSNAANVTQKANITIGQTTVGRYSNTNRKGGLGFWSRFLLPPAAPAVTASEGDLADRIHINWEPNPLSPAATGFKLYRDGALLATLDAETFSFIDFDVTAGNFYNYEVVGSNSLGVGSKGAALGFLNPNGVVTGQVKTLSGNPVPGAIVTLEPTLGSALSFDGVDDMAFATYDPAFPRSEFTVSCWVKQNPGNDQKAIFDMGSSIHKNWWLHTLPAASGTGFSFSIGTGASVTTLTHAFPSGSADDWHFVAATYNGSALLLYVDGALISSANATIAADSMTLFFGKKTNNTGFFNGKLDEVRLFDRQLSQTELLMFMNTTVSPGSEGLKAYWKFDEGVGSKAFGQSAARQKVYLCGASWSGDRASLVNAALTNESGFYEISGVNYGPGSTFTAKAAKNSYFNQSLEFNGANQTYANLTNFDLPDSATITLAIKPFAFSGSQVFLSKANASGGNLLSLGLNNTNLEMSVGSQTHSFGALTMDFHQLAFTLRQNGTSLEVSFYKNGSAAGSHIFTGFNGNFAGLPWKLGAKASGAATHSNYFTGLVDEAAFYSTLLPPDDIQTISNTGTNSGHLHLKHWFNLNEGDGTALHDMGQAMSGDGVLHGAGWSASAAISQILPHEFNPATRLVTLNPSSTSADEVDFFDKSTIPVSGYVRFEGTTCFQEKAEILVNGESYSPAIFTDAEGKFLADFEPGKSYVLSPKMEDHVFNPAQWSLNHLTTPVAGILFRNQTKRQVAGQLAGGLCRKSVIPTDAMGNPTAIVKVKVATLDGCFEKELTLTNPNGKFTFTGVPPDSVTVALTEHSNPVIYNYFQLQGGATLDLKADNDTTDFIYFAPPQVEMTPLPLNTCNQAVIEPEGRVSTTVRVYEDYDGGRCYLDTAMLHVENDISRHIEFDTMMTGGRFVYKYSAGAPNIVSPYKKVLQVTTTVHDELATGTLEGVVLGIRPRNSSFVSAAPQFPDLILHDPPGDASYATIEQGTTTCKTLTTADATSIGGGGHVTVHLGPDINIESGTPFLSKETQIDFTADLGYQISYSRVNTKTNEMDYTLDTFLAVR
jgi:hypothetical protein